MNEIRQENVGKERKKNKRNRRPLPLSKWHLNFKEKQQAVAW